LGDISLVKIVLIVTKNESVLVLECLSTCELCGAVIPKLCSTQYMGSVRNFQRLPK
jgi:hypothetical protein